MVKNSQFNLNSEMEAVGDSRHSVIAARPKAVLKHSQSKRWREVRCGLANAKRLDCVRFIAAFPTLAQPWRRPSSEFEFNRVGRTDLLGGQRQSLFSLATIIICQ
jgi:hypothetical protein